MKLWLILHLLSGGPFAALVDSKTCLTAAASFQAGHRIEILGLDGDKDTVIDVVCIEEDKIS